MSKIFLDVHRPPFRDPKKKPKHEFVKIRRVVNFTGFGIVMHFIRLTTKKTNEKKVNDAKNQIEVINYQRRCSKMLGRGGSF